jgi:hypothetical protein
MGSQEFETAAIWKRRVIAGVRAGVRAAAIVNNQNIFTKVL